MRPFLLAALAMAIAATAVAYEPPSKQTLDALRLFTFTDSIAMYVEADPDCDVDAEKAEGVVEETMSDAGINRVAHGQFELLAVEAQCMVTSSGLYVYNVDPKVYVILYVDDGTGGEVKTHMEIPLYRGVLGITRSPATIEAKIETAAAEAIADILYAHRDRVGAP